MDCRILLTGFRDTSSEQLLLAAHSVDTLLLPNDKQIDGQLLVHRLLNTHYDLVICSGQRPNIKDKVHIETTASENGVAVQTAVDCQRMRQIFEMCGLQAKLSYNAGSSFCNSLYFKGLQFIKERNLNTVLIFVHIPFGKNMSSQELFEKSFCNVLEVLKGKGVEALWMK